MTRRLLTLLIAVCLAGAGLSLVAAHASATPGPVGVPGPSDRPNVPLSRAQGHSTNAALAGGDAANTYVYEDYPAVTPADPYWQFGSREMVESVIPSSSVGYFYSNSFYLVGGSALGGYFGQQTRLINCTPGCVNQGRGFIASVWGATGATPAAGSVAIHGTEVGSDFWSLHYAFNWVTGHVYQYTTTHDFDYATNTFRPTMRFGVVDVTTGASYFLGTISVPAGWTSLTANTVQWTEEYFPNTYSSCSLINVSKAQWQRVGIFLTKAFAFGTVAPTVDTPVIQSGTGCTNSADVYLGAGNWRQVVGALS